MARKNKGREWSASGLTPLLDLFMLATFVFAMNADVADKKYEQQYQERLEMATNETHRVASQLSELEILARRSSSLVSLYSNKFEKVSVDNRSIEEENRILHEQLKSAQSTKMDYEVQLEDATNKLASVDATINELEKRNHELDNKLTKANDNIEQLEKIKQENSTKLNQLQESLNKLQKRIEDYADLKKQYDHLVDLQHNKLWIENGETNISVNVFITQDSRLFWENNHETTSCSFKDELDDFLKTKSRPENVNVQIHFIRFYNCEVEAEDVIKQLQMKIGQFSPAPGAGNHIIYWKDNKTIFVDKDQIQFENLCSKINSVADEDKFEPKYVCPVCSQAGLAFDPAEKDYKSLSIYPQVNGKKSYFTVWV